MKKNIVKSILLVFLFTFLSSSVLFAKNTHLYKEVILTRALFKNPHYSVELNAHIRQNDSTERAEEITYYYVELKKPFLDDLAITYNGASIVNNGNEIEILVRFSRPVNGKRNHYFYLEVPRPNSGNICDGWGNCKYSVDPVKEVE